MWIDTHCHFDGHEFEADRAAVDARARAAGVELLVMPSGSIADAPQVRALARQWGHAYALGTHPLWLDGAHEDDIGRLRDALRAARDDPRLVAIGEIGVDLAVAGLDPVRQQWFYREQLKVARDFDLPVIVHVRRSADLLLKHLRQVEVAGGIVHAFNGSRQQADQLLARGMKLGFGGAMTYSGSLHIRHLAATLPDDAWVLETDAPYIPPAWLRVEGQPLRNEPAELPRIAQTLQRLRAMDAATAAALNRRNALAALPRLAPLLGPA